MDEGKQTFRDLLVGIVLIGVLLIVIGIFMPGSKLGYYIGLAIGLVVALGMAFDMYSSIGRGLTMETKQASNYFRKKVLVRIGFMVIVLLVALFVEEIQLLSVMFGILTLKFSAYIQPLTHRFFKNK